MSPREEAEKLRRQVEELLAKRYIRESMSQCAVRALLTPMKDGTWHMCVDSQAINKITIRYRFPIPRIDDLLHQISEATVFTRLDLKSGIMAPLTECMKSSKFTWTVDGEAAFRLMKDRLTTAPILAFFEFTHPFELHIDMSKVGIGGVLSQQGWPVAFLEFILYTDHAALRPIHQQDKVSSRYGQWMNFLDEFTFFVNHKAVVSNRVADALSRRSNLLVTLQVEVPGFDSFHDLFVTDPYFSEILLDVLLQDGFLF
ncbi:uncharacterized protein LOC120273159 [Dioscorea cayenensis subsp. rotundata]|uniref:Uncharacterized protein LOC120273159 n=1 Tax=Dioscorea cayennensis subsp. rotundata TaxID=55577 RepID=A0AB40C802_DIOCR|nr:uncharacterized protein LOC120273159 [Dioscorea cayenensis subsp. rotundata]